LIPELGELEVADSIPAFVAVLDAAGKILFWNALLEQTTGFSRAEMFGRDGRDIVAAGERKLVLKSGGHRLVRWQISAVSGKNRASLTCALGIDVTAEKDTLRRTLNAERLAAVGTLASGLAHELRNPLNSASLQLKVLEGRLERGEGEIASLLPILALVNGEVERIDHTLNDFLDFARAQPLRLRHVDLNKLLGDAAEGFQRQKFSSGIALELELDSNVGAIELDAERMRQVVLHLLQNSAEALVEGGRIWLRSRAADADGFVMVEVEDTGPGFPENAPLFDAFFTTKSTGTGLGLSIVHRVISDHGGSVHASSVGGRTRFALRLPQHSR